MDFRNANVITLAVLVSLTSHEIITRTAKQEIGAKLVYETLTGKLLSNTPITREVRRVPFCSSIRLTILRNGEKERENMCVLNMLSDFGWF
jgi:hypothetical protein